MLFRTLLLLGRRLGDILYFIPNQRRHIARVNIGLAFPTHSSGAQKKLLRRHLQSMGMGIMEAFYAWNARKKTLQSLGTVTGLEHLPKDQGAILLTPHISSLEICCCLLGCHAPLNALYKRQKPHWLNNAMIRGRNRFLTQSVFKDDIKTMITVLKNTQHILYAADQHYAGKKSVYVDFFNTPAATRTALSKVVQLSNAAVLPITLKRLPNYRYQVEIHPAISDFGTEPATDAQTVMSWAEYNAKAVPEQYFWVHQRFKTHPDGTQNRYTL